MCVEEANRPTETASRQADVTESHQVMKRELQQANETIASLLLQLSRLQLTASKFLHHNYVNL